MRIASFLSYEVVCPTFSDSAEQEVRHRDTESSASGLTRSQSSGTASSEEGASGSARKGGAEVADPCPRTGTRSM